MTRLSRIVRKLKEEFKNFRYPQNDIDAWQMYPDYNFVYNKIFVCKFQKISYAPFPIEPKKLPVISKPMINLYGMGLNTQKIEELEDLDINEFPNNFWMEYLEGDHLSWDLVINEGEILYSTYFIGHKSKYLGLFNYWEWDGKYHSPNKIIKHLVNVYFKEYTGSMNIETIGGKIIEVHLRMGDIDLTPCELLENVLLNYQLNLEVMDKHFKKLRRKKFAPIYLIPVWQEIKEMSRNDLKEIQYYLEDHLENDILENNDIFTYYFDSANKACPSKYKRWFLLATEDINVGMKLKKKIEGDLRKYQIK